MKNILTTLALAAATTAAHAAITYVDADHSASPSANTSVTGGAALASGALGGWDVRGLGAAPLGATDTSNFANNGGVLQSSGTAGSELTTSITGLSAADDHVVYVFFWTPDNNPNWDVRAGLTSGALTTFTAATATQVTAATVGNITGLNVLGQGTDDFTDFVDGNRLLYYAPLGTVAAGATSIDVFIDDFDQPGITGDERTWYDGVGFEPVPEPSTALLGLFGLLGLARRRR